MPETRLAHLHPLRWLGQRDRGFAALRRATRAAIIMPAMVALGDKVIGNPQVATFAAFGSFAMLLLVDFGGTMAERLQAEAALVVTGGGFVCLATLASQAAWLAAVAMAVAGFGVILAGVVSSVLAGATTALLLAFILPVSLAAPASAVPGRLAGWGMAGGVALAATAVLWPAPARDRLRGAAAAACRALATRLRAGVAYLLSGMAEQATLDRDHAAAQADQAVEALRGTFLATPYRPTGLSPPARTTVRLVDELIWLNSIVIQPGLHRDGVHRAALTVKQAAAAVLDRAADLLGTMGGSSDELDAALTELAAAHAKMQEGVTAGLPAPSPPPGGEQAAEFITSLDPAFRAEELSYAVSLIARTVELTAAAERRRWRGRGRGRPPPGGRPGRRAAELAGAVARPPARRCAGDAVRGAGTDHVLPRAALGLVAQQLAWCGRAGAGRARRETDRGPALVLGGPRRAVGAALQCAEHRAGRRSRHARHGSGFHHRRRPARGDRHEHHVVVVPAAAGGLSRRGRPGGHLVRRGAGGVHAHSGDLVQHHPAGRMARGSGTNRRHSPRRRREPGRGCPVLAAGRGTRAPQGAGGGVRRQRGLPRQHGAIRDVTRRPGPARTSAGRRCRPGRRGVAPARRRV